MVIQLLLDKGIEALAVAWNFVLGILDLGFGISIDSSPFTPSPFALSS